MMRLLVVLFVTAGVVLLISQKKAPFSNVEYVDPSIGNVGHLLEPTRPAVHLPNQMIRVAPDRRDHLDQYISSFPLNIVSHRLGQVFALKPCVTAIDAQAFSRRFRFDHDLEKRHPWLYSTWLLDDDVRVSFTPGAKTGFYKFEFPEAGPKGVLFSTYNDGAASYSFRQNQVVEGLETYHGDIPVYTYGEFNIAGTPGYLEQDQYRQGNAVWGRSPKAAISFPEKTRTVEFRYAISYVSREQARANFDQGIRDRSFDDVQAAARGEWSAKLDQIQVEGGTTAQKRSFFTALYRTYERMVDITEDGKYYSGFDKTIHTDSRPFYVDDWSWDTYLAHHPLRMILQPDTESDMLQSYVRMYEQSGWMPTFPVLFGDHACMNGFHSSIVFLDALRKEIQNVDFSTAYAGMRKNATDATMIPWVNGAKTTLDDYYHKSGYFPALAPGEAEPVKEVHAFEKRQAVAVTLGHSYDDWAVAEMAKDLKKLDDYDLFHPRSSNYKNLWKADQQFFLPKNGQGQWIPIDPAFDGGMGGRDYYDENNGWTYLWQVQQDIPGLMALMGGKKGFENRLDQLFTAGLGRTRYEFWAKFPDASALVGQFSMGNEPSMHIPYLYNFTDAPWKTQQQVRFLLDVWFKDNVFGIPGDEDGGGMTSFVVFSSMGFYPISPGIPVYTIGSPVFSKVTIRLANGKLFTVDAPNCSDTNKYIQSAKFNGKLLDSPWFTHEQLVNGGKLELVMGPYPNKSWGRSKPAIDYGTY